ncbi:MAG: hypothetical protein OEL20_04595 [Sulfuritalea sp.]|nr:hypothetical protein [Sulfuritalea sp.]
MFKQRAPRSQIAATQSPENAFARTSDQSRRQERTKTPATKKTLRRLERLLKAAHDNEGSTTPWESEFLADVKTRIERYGRAFGNPELGNLNAPVSVRQALKLRQVHRSIKKHQEAR